MHTMLWIYYRCPVEKAIRHSVRKYNTKIVCGIQLRRRLSIFLNVARDSQNISSTWSYTLHDVVQTYDVEMNCQRSIYSVSVTNNHLGLEFQALQTAMWLKISIQLVVALLIFKTA